MPVILGGAGIVPSSRGMPTSAFTLPAGQSFIIPSGSWVADTGLYATIEKFDPITNTWRHVGDEGRGMNFVLSDGNTLRIVNRTGCAAGALLTNAGSGYTSAPVITASAGGSTWVAVMGSLISTSTSIVFGGTNYTYPPMLQIQQPGSTGIQATATCTISAGAVNAVTVTNQGGGYLVAPTINVVNDSRDTTGGGATITCTLTGSGTVNGVLCVDHGTAQTSVPTLTFTGGGGSNAAATVIMNFALTGYTVGTAGAVLATPASAWGVPDLVSGSAAYTNPQTQTGIVNMRQGLIKAAISGAALTATGLVVLDGGCYETVPALQILQSGVATTYPIGTATVGGQVASVQLIAV